MGERIEDQDMEIEALEAIFQQDFKLTKPSPGAQFELTLLPTTNINHVILLMKVVFPPKYPDVAPQIELVPEKGLQPKHIRELTALTQKSVNDGIGEVMIFAVSEVLKEWLVEHNQPEKDLHEQMMERNKVAESESEGEEEEDDYAAPSVEIEEEEYTNPLNIKPETLVSMETFKWWKERFDAEQALKKGEVKVEGALTGRQLYQMNLVKEEQDGDGGKETKEGDQVFWFNESIYEDLGDEDLDIPSDENGGDDDEGDYSDEGDEGDEEEDDLVAKISQKNRAPTKETKDAPVSRQAPSQTAKQSTKPSTPGATINASSSSSTTFSTTSSSTKSVPPTKSSVSTSKTSASQSAPQSVKPSSTAEAKTSIEQKSQSKSVTPVARAVQASAKPQGKGQSFSVKDGEGKDVQSKPNVAATQKIGSKPEPTKGAAESSTVSQASAKSTVFLNDDEEDDDEDLLPNMNRQQKQTPKAQQNVAKAEAKTSAKASAPATKPQDKKPQPTQQKPAASQSGKQPANTKAKPKATNNISFG